MDSVVWYLGWVDLKESVTNGGTIGQLIIEESVTNGGTIGQWIIGLIAS